MSRFLARFVPIRNSVLSPPLYFPLLPTFPSHGASHSALFFRAPPRVQSLSISFASSTSSPSPVGVPFPCSFHPVTSPFSFCLPFALSFLLFPILSPSRPLWFLQWLIDDIIGYIGNIPKSDMVADHRLEYL